MVRARCRRDCLIARRVHAPSMPLRRLWRATGRTICPPLGVWLVATAVVFVTCTLDSRSPVRIATWDYGDPGLYMDIARHGLTLYRCSPGAAEWCGNAGWFPGYPWLTRFVGLFGIGIGGAALALSWFFTLGTLMLLWTTFLRRRLEAASLAALLYAAFAPGMIFGYAMYPLSLEAFLTVAYLWLVYRERWAAAGLVGAGLVLVYPVALAAPAAVSCYVLVEYRRSPRTKRLAWVALAVGPAVISIGSMLLEFKLSLGHWNAYFLIQDKYGHTVREPFASLLHAIVNLANVGSFPLKHVAAFQTLLVTAVLVAILVRIIKLRGATPREDSLVATWAVATWLLPSSESHLAGHRGDAALLPAAILLARLPRKFRIGAVLAAVAISVPLEILYLRGGLS
jgi:hypothetical protein